MYQVAMPLTQLAQPPHIMTDSVLQPYVLGHTTIHTKLVIGGSPEMGAQCKCTKYTLVTLGLPLQIL